MCRPSAGTVPTSVTSAGSPQPLRDRQPVVGVRRPPAPPRRPNDDRRGRAVSARHGVGTSSRPPSRVTGPSLTSAHCMLAPNRPGLTLAPRSREPRSRRAPPEARHRAGCRSVPARTPALAGVAVQRELPRPRAPAPPPPALIGRRRASAARAPSRPAGPRCSSSWVTPTSTQTPARRRIPTISPSTCTLASLNRWTTARTGPCSQPGRGDPSGRDQPWPNRPLRFFFGSTGGSRRRRPGPRAPSAAVAFRRPCRTPRLASSRSSIAVSAWSRATIGAGPVSVLGLDLDRHRVLPRLRREGRRQGCSVPRG